MHTINEIRDALRVDPENWRIYIFNFVDDFRYYKDISAIKDGFSSQENDRYDALLASTVEYLCNEMNLSVPDWTNNIKHCKEPWFVSGMESLKSFALVESPACFRMRNVFVLSNFLSRV